MSNSGRTQPGTKYVLVTNSDGYITDMQNVMVDTPYGECVLEMTKQLTKQFKKPVKMVILDREGCGSELDQRFKSDIEVKTLTPLRKN